MAASGTARRLVPTTGQTAPLVVIGAGPFGLAVAADARRHGVPCRVFGQPMGFWRRHMPAGMILRSASDWHLDPQGELTIVRYFAERGRQPGDVEPLPVALYLDYVEWFQRRAGITVEPATVQGLVETASGFAVELPDRTVHADNVVLAVGLHSFAHVPPSLTGLLPAGSWVHTRDFVDFGGCAGGSFVIVGGRQSAFEWAALLVEAGAAGVTVVLRHDPPAFTASDWAWATALARQLESDPGWYRRLSEESRQEITTRMWGEGRLKVEPWLEARLAHPAVRVLPGRAITAGAADPRGGTVLSLDDGTRLRADRIVLATGYLPDASRIPLLAAGGLLDRLSLHRGCPRLDEGFQTTVPGLYATGALASADFGPFFGFTVAASSAAAVLGRAVRARMRVAQAG